MDELSVYRAPDANLIAEPAAGGVGQLSPLMLEELHKTRPWVFFLGILGLLLSGLMVVVFLVMALAAAFGAGAGDPSALVLIPVGLVVTAFYGLPAALLLRYGLALRQLRVEESVVQVERALARQRAFWRWTGILMLAVFVLYGLTLVIALGAGLVGSLSG